MKQAVARPVEGADKVARMLLGGLAKVTGWTMEPSHANGHPALIVRFNGELDTVIALRIDNGLISGLYAVRNPAKLSHMEQETALRR